MQFRVLGPLEVVDDEGRVVPLSGARQRALLAALLLRRNEVAQRDRLIDDLWGDSPPATGAKALQVAVSQLRKAVGDGLLQTRPAGYLLNVEPEQLDLALFELLGDAARDAEEPAEAAAKLRQALSLWRGPALADVSEDFARAEADRLEELRLGVLEERIQADLAAGRHAELVPELEALVARHPLRERLREHLMLALYRSGRQAEALELYRMTRRMLADELGIEPSTGLQELERAILRHDPELEPTPRRRAAARSRRLWPVAAVVAATLAAVLALGLDGEDTLEAAAPDSVAVIDPDRNALIDSIPVGKAPGPIAAGAGSVWVLNRNSRTLTQIDPQERSVVSTQGVSDLANALAVGDFVFVLDGLAEKLFLIHPRHGTVVDGFVLDDSGLALPGAALAVRGEEVWATDEAPPGLVRIKPAPFGTRIERVGLPGSPSAVVAEAERVWVALDDGRLVAVDRRTLAVEQTRELGRSATALALAAGAVWLADGSDGTVIRARTRPFSFVTRIRVGRDPVGLASGAGSVWVANRRDRTVSRIDPRTNEVVATIRLGRTPQAVVVAGGLVWVSVRD